MDDLLTAAEVAEQARVSQSYVRQLAARGDLACYRLGRALRFRRADVDDYLERHRHAGAA
jgi:excisionase family DNA binding protein